jgi:hypothetical protein
MKQFPEEFQEADASERAIAKELLAIQGGSHEDALILLEDYPDPAGAERIEEIMVKYCDSYNPDTDTCDHI